MVLVKKWPFFQPFFFRQYTPENVFYDILEQKMPFQAIKTRSSKSRKMDIFLKGLTHGFGSKFAIFSIFFSYAIYARKMSFTIFQKKKNAFLGYKNKMFKKPKIDILPKLLTYGIGQKIAILPTFLLMQYRPGKQLLRYSRAKKCLSRLKIQEVQKVEKLTFFLKTFTHGFGPKMAIFLGNIDQENVLYGIVE